MADAILSACTNCGEMKPPTAFRVGHRQCIPCVSGKAKSRYANNAEYRALLKERNAQWRAKNGARKSAADKAWREANKERVYKTKREWKLNNWDHAQAVQLRSRHRNLETYRAREAAYREQNRLACNERIKQWKQKNPHKTVCYESKRRAVETQAIPAWASLDAISDIYAKAREMGKSYHVDHVVPLISKLVCGLHCESNLEIVPATENLRKNNRWWPDMWEPM